MPRIPLLTLLVALGCISCSRSGFLPEIDGGITEDGEVTQEDDTTQDDAVGDGDAAGDGDESGGDGDAGDEDTQPVVSLVGLVAPFPDVRQGQLGVPLVIEFDNEADHHIDLHGLDVIFSREADEFSWRSSGEFPLALAAQAHTTLDIYLAIGSGVELGEVQVNVQALVLDPVDMIPWIAGPAEQPVVLTVGPAQQTQDTDGDGLNDDVENIIGSNPADPDTDGDALDDGVEAPDGVPLDTDSDGTPDFLDDDSDDGGMPDVLEGAWDTDPTWSADDIQYNILQVNDTSDELEPGTVDDLGQAGPTLSLREALTIAANLAGADRILFDPDVFPPGTTIEVNNNVAMAPSMLPEMSDADTFLDGAGVVLHWDVPTYDAESLILVTGERCAVRGVSLDLTPSVFCFEPPISALKARLALDTVVVAVAAYNLSPDRGPSGAAIFSDRAANMFVYRCDVAKRGGEGLSNGADFDQSPAPIVWRSTFEVVHSCIDIFGGDGCLAEENSCINQHRHAFTLVGGSLNTFRRNDITSFGESGIRSSFSDDNLLEENHIHDCNGEGIHLGEGCERITMSRNSITANVGPAMVCDPHCNNRFEQPTIEQVFIDRIEGTHPGENGVIIEVFADPEDEAELYLGVTELDNGTWILLLLEPVPLDYNVTATATSLDGNTSMLTDPVPGQ